MHARVVNYRKRDQRHCLVDVGFWLRGIRRPLLLCRLRGHRPIVDGYGGLRGDWGRRWAICGRCGVRPKPQGNLLPESWPIGARYTGDHAGPALMAKGLTGYHAPGPWPASSQLALGGQLVVGDPHHKTWGFSLKVGNKGSEHTLAASFHLGIFGHLYLHTERFGSWLVHRLNGTGYQSKVISLRLSHGHLWWQLWADRDGAWSNRARGWAKWHDHSLQIDPRTILLGPKQYSYADVGEPVMATVRLPHGDQHDVVLQLQRQTLGRKRGWWRRQAWTAQWEAPVGIPTKPGRRGRIFGSGQTLTDAERAADWVTEATDAIAAQIVRDRARYDWLPHTPVLVTAEPDRD
ncbi:hypothetical protein [Rhizomonospora bruguierae]|uniref:hypothetical protein n=1 Tax=Rhizomonospora bruguierae TaxID=1581705 RepID=UPI001BCF8FE1|nr:hypothetical protein [Micromonospora sp. NBRC 107566]